MRLVCPHCGETVELTVKPISEQAPAEPSPRSTAGTPQSSPPRAGSSTPKAASTAGSYEQKDGEVSGILMDVMESSGKNGPFLKLIIKPTRGSNIIASLFDNHSMPHLDGGETQIFALMREARGKPVKVFLKTKGQYTNVVAVTRCADDEWEFSEEGYLPVRQQREL